MRVRVTHAVVVPCGYKIRVTGSVKSALPLHAVGAGF
jgi:hypothetical protein